MTGPAWNEDDPADYPLIQANVARLVAQLRATTTARALPGLDELRRWHEEMYAGCAVPIAGYRGHFRGDPAVPELVGYEVFVGELPDGTPDRKGYPSSGLSRELDLLIDDLGAALTELDAHLPIGTRPTTVDQLQAVTALCAVAHGKWVRLHPFANGNGRTARMLVAFIATRYSVPLFLDLKPRPHHVAYGRAGRDSMGRPPDFQGDQSIAVHGFASMLARSLMS